MGDADASKDPIQSSWYMYVFPGGGSGRTKKEDTVEIEKKKQNIHSFQKKRKKKKEKRKERREIRGSTQRLPPSSTSQ